MKSREAWGWLAAGILALGLNGIYHDVGAGWTHRVVQAAMNRLAERTAPVLALATGRAEWFMARSQAVVAQNEVSSCPWASALAHIQSNAAEWQRGIARIEAISARPQVEFARRQAQLARGEANRARIQAQLARVQARRFIVDVKVPDVYPRIHVNIPQVHLTHCSW